MSKDGGATMGELKPCPFCGGDKLKPTNIQKVYKYLGMADRNIICETCDVIFEPLNCDMNVFDWWNTRPPSVGLAEYADKVVEEFKNKFTFEGDNGEDTLHMLFCNHGTHKSIAKDTDIIDFLRTAILNAPRKGKEDE